MSESTITTQAPDAGATADTSSSATGTDTSTTNQGATTETSPGSNAQQDATTDGSSPSDQAKTTPVVSDRDQLLAVVRDAVKPKTQETPGETVQTPNAETKTEVVDPNAPDPLDKDLSEPEMELLKPQVRGRMRKLIQQRGEARIALEAAQPELAAHRQLQGYLTQHQLAPDDVNMLLGIGSALRKGDFQAFLSGVQPYVDLALQALGHTVAPDLLGRVEDGSMSEDAAKELTRTRMVSARHQVEAETQTQRHVERDSAQLQGQLHGAITTWEAGLKTRDPDYALKEAQIRRTSQALIAEHGRPRTPADAVALAQRAYEEVTSAFGRARPAAQATRPAPSGVSLATTSASPQPTSMLDAVRLGLERSRRSAAA